MSCMEVMRTAASSAPWLTAIEKAVAEAAEEAGAGGLPASAAAGASFASKETFLEQLREIGVSPSYYSSYPYVLCNEEHQQEVLHCLSERSVPLGVERAHLGFSVWFNYDVIAVTKPSYAVLCDIDGHVITIYAAIKECLARASDRKEFIALFKGYLEEHCEELWGEIPLTDLPKICDIEAEAGREESWLSSDERFATVKKMHEEKRVLSLCLDITDREDRFLFISKWLEDNKLMLDTLYASNIIEWLGYKGLSDMNQYLRNLRTIAHKDTFFIDAFRVAPRRPPVLHLSQGKDAISMPSKRALK